MKKFVPNNSCWLYPEKACGKHTQTGEKKEKKYMNYRCDFVYFCLLPLVH